MSKYEKSKSWNMFTEDNKIFVTKGSDEIYYLDEIKEEQVQIVYDAYCNNTFDDIEKNEDYNEIVNKLQKSGVIYQKKFKNNDKKLKLNIKYYGKPNKDLENEINNIICKRKNITLVDNVNDSDLALLIRINVPFKNLLENYSNIKKPHILVDLSYANNISVGPLVYEETACLGCYIGRITKNWGDALPPIEPAVTQRSELISAFIVERIDEFITYGNCPDLINCVWNYDVNTFSSKYNKVYKLPWCPLCNNENENTKINLPWEMEFDYE